MNGERGKRKYESAQEEINFLRSRLAALESAEKYHRGVIAALGGLIEAEGYPKQKREVMLRYAREQLDAHARAIYELEGLRGSGNAEDVFALFLQWLCKYKEEGINFLGEQRGCDTKK